MHFDNPADPADPSIALLFDLDGTLTDSAPGIHNSFRHALSVIGAPEPDARTLATIVGPPMLDNMRAYGVHGPDLDLALQAYVEEYSRIGWRENSPFAEVVDVARDLAAAGRRLAIATSKRQTMAAQIATHFAFADAFEFIGGAADNPSRRAKKDVIEHVLTQMSIGADQVVMIGDRMHDVEGAAALGIPTVAVTWGYGDKDEHASAQWCVASAADLRELVGV